MRHVTNLGTTVGAALLIVLAAGVLGDAWRSGTARAAPTARPQEVVVTNTTAAPVPTFSAPQPFQAQLLYNPSNTPPFQTFTAPAGQRIVIQDINLGVLVKTGVAPVGSIGVLRGGLGVYSASLGFTKISNFYNVQDRYGSHLSTLFYLEPGDVFTWYVTDADGEQFFAEPGYLNAYVDVTGTVVNVGP